ncbi:hypothetical protein PV328_009494 [Microctonus aethiopoides]|uniref:Potassium channel domain-containing protein n=1 Tax=Microctonus aethiopoides TaxID=144406 RepID=A0AA39C5Y3_9HYME|nr:hypothetical protein PV328_009494 [Microctonus aethiopoides]
MSSGSDKTMKNPKKNISKLKSITGSVGLLVMLMIYTAIGGLVFRQLELPIEIIRLSRIRTILLTQRNHFINQILNNTDLNTSTFADMMQLELQSYEIAIQEATQGGFLINSVDEFHLFNNQDIANLPPVTIDRWSIIQAVFFASTVLTTIGYGNVVPSSIWGRVFCIFFAFIGIPLTLTVIAHWGKLFAEIVSEIASKISENLPSFITQFYPNNTTGQRSLGAFAAIGLLFIYISCGATMFMLWEEDWNFFDGFYFCFVTMTTIGFGDLVPKKPKYMLFCTLYILVGLALTGTIIELVRRQYAQSWRRLQALRGPIAEVLRKISEHAGGDISIMQSDLRNLLTVIAMPKLKRKDGKNTDAEEKEWQEAVEAVLRNITTSVPDKNYQKPIMQIVIYESSV